MGLSLLISDKESNSGWKTKPNCVLLTQTNKK